MTSVRVGVIGFGVGEAHALAFAADPRCELVVVCDLSAAAQDRAHERFPHVRVTGDAEEVIDDPDIDAVAIATYDDLHFAQAARALQRGKHVFVEKPLCRSLGELRELKLLWERHRPALLSNLVLRAAPLYRWLCRARGEGELGDVYAFDGDYHYGRIEKITGGWRKDVDAYSVIQGGGIHLVDLMIGLAGERPIAVSAVGNRIATEGTAFRYDDFVAATYRFRSGLIGRITANFASVHPHQHVVRVFGTRATFINDDRGPRVRTSRDPGAPDRPLGLDGIAPKGALIPEFIDHIVSGTRRPAAAQREWDVLSACVAADESLGSRREVEIAYV